MAYKFKRLSKSFTLIELIIVIAIIAVLSASAFLLLSQWMSKSRDSRRISDLKTLEKSINISFLSAESSSYPLPDPNIIIKTDNYWVLWSQWKFWDSITQNVNNLNKIPKDPSWDYYDYSVTQDRKSYELLALLENEKKIWAFGNAAYANANETTFILSNYDWYIVATSGWVSTLYSTDSIFVEPNLLDSLTDEYTIDLSSDILIPDSDFTERSEVKSVNVTSLLDSDDSNDDATLSLLTSTFPDLIQSWKINNYIQVSWTVTSQEEEDPLPVGDYFTTVWRLWTSLYWNADTIVKFNITYTWPCKVKRQLNEWPIWEQVCAASDTTGTYTIWAAWDYKVWIESDWLTRFYNAWFDWNYFGKILSVTNWWAVIWTNMSNMFSYANNLTSLPLAAPNLTSVIDMSEMFYGASKFNVNISNWNTSNIQEMAWLFYNAVLFNQPLDSWNITNVYTIRDMFNWAISFNQPLNSWNTSSIYDMYQTFNLANNFNQPLNNWDTSTAGNMWSMFKNAASFNQDLTSWCVANIETEPMFFASSSPLATNWKKPVWWTCN